jgi:hypothetical protein
MFMPPVSSKQIRFSFLFGYVVRHLVLVVQRQINQIKISGSLDVVAVKNNKSSAKPSTSSSNEGSSQR